MGYLAIYRKYRPQTFDKVIGQDHVVKTLVNQIKQDRIGHAYLFTGTRGTGKTSVAKIFARAINCEHPVNGSPCGKCDTCKALLDPSNIDVLEIDAASNNGVDEIRNLRENIQYPPVNSRYKVYIIDEVHMLSPSAFNALLKTLEEPPKHAVFILATTEVQKMPATILSRCMRFDFRLVDIDKLAKLVADIYDDLGKKYTKEAVYAIAKLGEGSVRDALSVADICLSLSDGELTYGDVLTATGASDRTMLRDFVTALTAGDVGAVLNLTDKLINLGKSVGLMIKDVNSYLRDVMITKTCVNAKDILKLPEDLISELEIIADSTTKERILRAIEIFAETESDLKYSNHPRILFETAAIKATRPENDYNIDALLSRISVLEKKIDDLTSGKIQVSSSKPSDGNTVQNSSTRVVETIPQNNMKPSAGLTEITERTAEPVPQKTETDAVKQNSANGKVKLSECNVPFERIKGKLIKSLRDNNEIMLWSVVQTMPLTLKDNTLIITVTTESDMEIINRKESLDIIKAQLPEYDFDVEVRLHAKIERQEKLEEEIEKYKRIFGDDIVVVGK